MKKLLYIVGGVVVLILILTMLGGEEKTNPQTDPQAEVKKDAFNLYEQMIMDNAVTVIEKIPQYASSQRKMCTHKEGFLIEDPYGAEWYVAGGKIYAVNGLAKSLTPSIDYAPSGISYQSCY